MIAVRWSLLRLARRLAGRPPPVRWTLRLRPDGRFDVWDRRRRRTVKEGLSEDDAGCLIAAMGRPVTTGIER